MGQYIRDTGLAARNECVEFIEVLINGPEISRREIEENLYCRRAGEITACWMR